MKRAIICILFSIVLFQSCKKEEYSIVISYNELSVNPVEGRTVALDRNPSGAWDSYQSDNKKMATKAQSLIDEKTEKIKVDINGTEILNIEKL